MLANRFVSVKNDSNMFPTSHLKLQISYKASV